LIIDGGGNPPQGQAISATGAAAMAASEMMRCIYRRKSKKNSCPDKERFGLTPGVRYSELEPNHLSAASAPEK